MVGLVARQSVHDTADRTVLLNDARRNPVGRNVDAAVRDEQLRQLCLQGTACAVDVEHRNNYCVFACCLADERYGIRERVSFDTHENHIRRGSALLPRGKKAVHIDRPDRNALALIFSGYERQAVLLQDRKMLSACNKRGIRTGFAQIRAYRSANATGTDNHITQLHPLSLRLLFLHYSTKSAMYPQVCGYLCEARDSPLLSLHLFPFYDIMILYITLSPA